MQKHISAVAISQERFFFGVVLKKFKQKDYKQYILAYILTSLINIILKFLC